MGGTHPTRQAHTRTQGSIALTTRPSTPGGSCRCGPRSLIESDYFLVEGDGLGVENMEPLRNLELPQSSSCPPSEPHAGFNGINHSPAGWVPVTSSTVTVRAQGLELRLSVLAADADDGGSLPAALPLDTDTAMLVPS